MASETLNNFSKVSQGSTAIRRQIVGWTCIIATLIVTGLVVLGSLNSLGLLENWQTYGTAKAEYANNLTTTEIVVRPGDTLWSIAQSTGLEGRDVREVVDWIRQLNNLQSGSLSIGQVLLVPVVAPNP